MTPTLNEGLGLYLAEIGRHPVLDPSQEAKASRELLILSNLRLAVHIAKAYAYTTDHLLDLIQDANVGLCQAADAFDPSRGKFSVCASLYIRSAIRHQKRDGLGKPVRDRTDLPSTSNIEDLEGFDPAATDDPCREVHESRCLALANQSVTDRQRVVLQARLNGNTQQEIADSLNTSYQNIQQLERGAMRKIREALYKDSDD